MRTARMAAWGLVSGPVLTVWYRTLHATSEGLRISYAPIVSGRMEWLLERAPGLRWVTALHKVEATPVSPVKMLVGKVLVDSLLFQATFLNAYFVFMGVLEGLSPSEILEKTRAAFHRAWALSFLVWMPVQTVNLHFVSPMIQPTVVALVNVGWKTTLSLLNHYHDHGSPRTVLAHTDPGVPLRAGEVGEVERLKDLAAELASEVERLKQLTYLLEAEKKALGAQLARAQQAAVIEQG